MTFLKPYESHLLSLLRIAAGLVIFSYGSQKVLGFPASNGMPPVGSIFWIAGMLELILGLLVTIGLFTRFSAFVLSGLMAFAYFIVHAPQSFYPAQNGGTAAILFAFIFLYLAAVGPDRISVDAKRR